MADAVEGTGMPLKKNSTFRPVLTSDKPGAPCGSSFLNESFRNLLRQRLKDETYLDDDDGETTEFKIDKAVQEFEKEIKPGFGDRKGESHCRSVGVWGLKRDDRKDFVKNAVNISRQATPQTYLNRFFSS